MIKVLSKHDSESEGLFQERMEVEVMKVCQHPNIIQLYDYYEDVDNMYIVMESIKGRDLYDYLKYRNSKNTEERGK